jgi:hypothetical protein
MADEDIVVHGEWLMRDSGLADFERVLETLIVLAHKQGRNFLAYLLIMALMHVQEEDQAHRSHPLMAKRLL